MKTEITLYIIKGEILKALPENHEGQYIDIDIEIVFSTDVEECHGVHNLCSYDYVITSIYVMEIEDGSKKWISDITESLEDIIFELIQERKVLI